MINSVKFALASVALATVVSATPVFVTAASANEIKHVELQDGTKVEIKGDEVFVVGKDGKEAPAPDGTHVSKDGTSITTKGGKIVK